MFGLIFGSFLNVVSDRFSNGSSIVKGRSRCDYCGHILRSTDLFPVISFVKNLGRCRYCRKKLSLYYPISELLTAFSFLSIFLFGYTGLFPFSLANILFYLFVISCMLVVLFSDLKYMIIPDQIIFFALPITLIYFLFSNFNLLINHLISAVISFCFFYFLYLITKRKGMGFGDIKLALWFGLLLGFPFVIISFYISFIFGAFVSLALVFLRFKKLKGIVPFGPFLILGAYICLFFGNTLLSFILRFI